MTIANDIVDLLTRKRRALTAEDIAEFLFGQAEGKPQRVTTALRELAKEGRLTRDGKGSSYNPYTYSLPKMNRDRRFTL